MHWFKISKGRKLKDLIIDEDSAVYKLFNYPFYCRVPYFSTISYEDLELYGTYLTKDENKAVYQPIDKIMTIVEMAEYFKNGIIVELAKPSESNIIYNIIMDHLKMWRDYGLKFGHPFDPPLEDLRLLSDLGEIIYPVANNYGKEPVHEKDLIDILTGLVPFDDNEFYNEYSHENIIGEIEFIKEKLGEYKRYGY